MSIRTWIIAVVVCLAHAGMARAGAELLLQGVPLDVAEKLADAKTIYVATERKDGSRSEPAPVWFGVMDGVLWFTTSPESHKGKRIRRGSPVYISVSGKKGPFLRMKAEIVQDGETAEKLGRLYERKYWIAWLGFFRPSRERVEKGQTLLIRVTPEGSLPPEPAPQSR
jgi:nitroimidazol reductase NimA-like FMN-containing flavoprotein (pyridoxamine 5'-phosphate oxidase superfamily)